MMPPVTKTLVEDADGMRWEYRRVSSVLERRRITSSVWMLVHGTEFLTMTACELRHIADVLDAKAEGQ